MIINEIKPDTIPIWKHEFLRKEHTNVVLEKIKAEIKALSNANPSYWHSGDMVEREDVLEIIDKYRAESEAENGIVIDKNLCDSCITKGCIFQSGIVRNHCDFYKAESEDKE